jgi:altronate hydrolase
MHDFIIINKNDNVAVALKELEKGTVITVNGQQISLHDTVPAGHKIALQDFNKGDNIIKYGSSIGHATRPVKTGEHVHVHNIRTNLSGVESYSYEPAPPRLYPVKPDMAETFMAYKRANGDIGIRNELWIVPTVGCVNGIAELAVKRFKKRRPTDDIDNIAVLSHPYGCSQLGEDHEATKVILQDVVKHPNAGGVLVLALGCENNQMDEFKASLGSYDTERVRFLIAQEVGDEIAAIETLLEELYLKMRGDRREAVPLGELKVGLKCGGSDGFSGITANPLVGLFSDYLIARGGTSVLGEVPEMFGAEKLLMARSKDKEVFEKNVKMINDFKNYFIENKQEIYENPSPGNKAGGITTLEDKSLGCTQKSGTATVVDVLFYGERLKERGLNLLSTPGNDLVAASAFAAAGCHLVLFTTGRGNPYGTFVPTVKIASNSGLAEKKPNWIDFDAGIILEAGSVESALKGFVAKIKTIAEGEKAKNELNEFSELAIFKRGVTL